MFVRSVNLPFSNMFFLLSLAEAKRRPKVYPHPVPRYPKAKAQKARVPCPESNYNFSYPIYHGFVVQKPAIYLYPTKEMNLTVGIDIHPEQFTAVVPEFDSPTSWNVTAKPNGEIIHRGKRVPYLFWEAKSDMRMKTKKGFLVKRGEAREFLEKTLTQLNLNEKEKFDFITYWLPEFNRLGDVFCSFQLKNYCHTNPLFLSEKPDTVIRVFIAIRKARPSDARKTAQKLPSVERKGFTVIEWGGSVITSPSQKITLLK